MRILIVDDEANIRRTTLVALEGLGHEVLEASNPAEALTQMGKSPELIFLDLRLGGSSGIELIPQLLELSPGVEIIVFTAYASIETAVESMRAGAVDFLEKPFTPEQLRLALGKRTKVRKLQARVVTLETALASGSPVIDLSTQEPAMSKVYELCFRVSSTPAAVLLLGESGTGKSVLARAIHEHSPRKAQPFITVNCPSLSRELLESELFGHVKGSFTGAVADTWGKVAKADGGTLFLDEIGELPLELQPKLLRLLQEREYERLGENKVRRAQVRVIAATNRNLLEAVKQGSFREDLYYRLDVISIHLPPLRARKKDLERMAQAYLAFFSKQCGKNFKEFSPAAQQAIQGYSWPGNLRELRNVIERAVILAEGESIQLEDLPAAFSSLPPKPLGEVTVTSLPRWKN